jgi:oligopeptidase B
MGAVYSQRPDIWRGIVAEVPFVDPVTTMLDPSAPLVAVEWDEWGDPRRPKDLAWMLDWSPYDNPPPLAERPRLLVTSVLYDSRVSVWEPARWVERLCSTGSSDSEVIFRVDLSPGAHAIPEGRYARLSYLSEIYAWVADCLGIALGNAADSGSV